MINNQNSDFRNYQQLLERVDKKFCSVQRKYPSAFQCGRGCFGCCRSDLSVTHVEAAHIAHWLDSRPQILSLLETKLGKTIEDNGNCEFLDDQGGCMIYEARPVVCRSHGAPTLIPSEDEHEIGSMDGDVCPLNFQEVGLDTLEPDDWIRLDTLNLTLSAVDLDFDSTRAGQRTSLKIKSFCRRTTNL